jgi:hypothetical protein
VTEPYRYLVERAIETEVTIGIGGERSIEAGDSSVYSVSLQSLTNVDTPYVRFDIGATDMGNSEYLLEGLALPYVVFGSNVGGQPPGAVLAGAVNNPAYGITPTGAIRGDVPWASLDGLSNTQGWNLAPGYAFDLAGNGFAGFTFNVQTYPGLREWLNYDFEGLRAKLYAIRPDWKAQGLLDGGVQDLNRIQQGLAAKFLSTDPEEHITKLEALSMPFRFDTLGAVTPLTRDEFIADQTAHAKRLRTAILADATASSTLGVLAADEAQWVQGWLAALEVAGLLRPADEAPPIRNDELVLSLNATLATGILLGRGGENYRTQADLLGFFAQVQTWYGDTARYAGDTQATKAPVDYYEYRKSDDGEVYSPVPVAPNRADYDLGLSTETQFMSFDVFVGGLSELEYLRHIGILDANFNPVGAQSLNLTQYLQQAANRDAAAKAAISVRGPQTLPAADGSSWVPADYALPYSIAFTNPGQGAVGEVRLVTELDADIDPRSLRLGDLKIGAINVHLPPGQAVFQGDFDFTGSLGFVLRVSAGIDAEARIATWLLQAIDPDTGEVLRDPARGLLLPSSSGQPGTGSVSYTVRAAEAAVTGAALEMGARVFFDDAPPIDSSRTSHALDAGVPQTTLVVDSSGNDTAGRPTYRVQWTATDDASGVKHVTVYVAVDGGDFKIWQKQVPGAASTLVYTGEAGRRYEFLAVATDNAGNREAATIANAVLPDDGSRADAEQALGANETVVGTPELPAATPGRSYADNTMFDLAAQLLPGFVVPHQPGDLQSVLAPMQLRGFASGFAGSQGDIGALAMVQLADGSVLASAGAYRNQVFRFAPEGGRSTTPLFELDTAVLDMALDKLGQLWVLTGAELLLLDAGSGAVIARHRGPGNEPLTHALAIDPTGLIYVASGNGVEIFDPKATDTGRAWRHFSNTRVGDLAFGPDGRLWGVRWTGSTVPGGDPAASTEIISFPMSGRLVGRAEVEYRLAGVVDSIAFGQAGSGLDGLLLASSNLLQRPVDGSNTAAPHASAVWMIELQSRRVLQLAQGGTRGETLLTTADGRVLVAQSTRIDEIAPIKAPTVLATSVADGALVPLPLTQIAVSFDQAMWTGTSGTDAYDAASVLNPANFRLVATGTHAGLELQPTAVRWDAGAQAAILTLPNLAAGGWRLEIAPQLRSAAQVSLTQGYMVVFTAVADLSHSVRLDFIDTRADRSSGEISYDVSITNIGVDDLRGPLMLLLDPGRYFGGEIVGGSAGGGDQSELWVIDLTAALQAAGGRLVPGATLARQTVSIRSAADFGTTPGGGELVKVDLGHGIYAVPFDNLPPTLAVVNPATGEAEATRNTLPPAAAGQAWTGTLQALDSDGLLFFWQLVQAPAGMTLVQDALVESGASGYGNRATLHWTPTTRDRADSEVLVRVIDSRGGMALRRFTVAVEGGNHVPVIGAVRDLALWEGETLSLPLVAADPDGEPLTVTVRGLPPGARYDAASGLLTWSPGYDQAGDYRDITIVASDGKHTVTQSFNITVHQGWAQPVVGAVGVQTLREGDRYTLQLAGQVPGGLSHPDGTQVTLTWSAPWLPGGATLNTETGWFEWTPGYNQAGTMLLPVRLTATYLRPSGEKVTTSVVRELELQVLNANGAPQFDPLTTWNVLEGQALRISVFAFDPDNPGFEPRVRLTPTSAPSGNESTAASVSYEVTGLPEGASFDAETLELVWTPGYAQAGTYAVTVVATDDGGGTGVPLRTTVTLPIVVTNANRAPQIGAIESLIVDRGATVELPVSISDADGNPVTVTVSGLPAFASWTQTTSGGLLRFAPGAQSRGDYLITVLAQDDGDGDVNQIGVQSVSFVLTVRSLSEAPVITVPRQSVAVVGQALVIPIEVSDLDQDALNFLVQGLPAGATLEQDAFYGRAYIRWTPTLAQLGSYALSLQVTDSGLPPANSGQVFGPNQLPVPNTTVADLRIVVRESNLAPTLIGVTAEGGAVQGDPLSGERTRIDVSEGVPLRLQLSALDADFDLVHWRVTGLPAGMVAEPVAGSDGQGLLLLRWTPGAFAAQDGAVPGTYRLSVTAGDGHASAVREIDLVVANVNQAPTILPLPLQLTQEGLTLGFTVRASDADNDAIRLSLVYDENTPSGVYFDAASGYFEWTPDATTVDNADTDASVFVFRFTGTDGSLTVQRLVQVRVFDVNRVPTLSTVSHALRVGQDFALPVVQGGAAGMDAIRAVDDDGADQTAALILSFTNLPEGARYDAPSGRLLWTPGPGQVGDFVVFAHASDGRNTTTRSFTLRVVADEAAAAPKILVNLTPSSPVLPGQVVLATVRATSFSPIATLQVQVRGAAVGHDDWTPVALDSLGRLDLAPVLPGLVEIRVTATDVDGFVATHTQVVRVRDPLDSVAPQLAWVGDAGAGAPALVAQTRLLQARITELQLMGWVLEIAPSSGHAVDESAWRTLASHELAGATVDGQLIDLALLDPSHWANGVYALRLRSWDLTGRTAEISGLLRIDSESKALQQAVATDAVFQLGGHALALTRSLDVNPHRGAELGNWDLPLLDTRLTHDQGGTTALGLVRPWSEGARVWLQVPASLGQPEAGLQFLSFTLGSAESSAGPGTPVALRPAFTGTAGWTLQAVASDGQTEPALQRQGQRLLDASTGLPWVPAGYQLTGPDGTRWHLDARGRVQAIRFADGVQWLVSDAGVALVGSTDPGQRIDFVRDTRGRIEQVVGPRGAAAATLLLYRYDAQDRVVAVRNLYADRPATLLGYHADGRLMQTPVVATLGTASAWGAGQAAPTDRWSGPVTGSVNLAFMVRESEVAATVKAPGATGAVILVVETTGAAATLQAEGAQVVGQAISGGRTVTLLRVTEAGLKLLTVTADGDVTLHISVAGDIDDDGDVDGADSVAWEVARSDLNGDGQADAADRQLLYANHGWRANQAPVALAQPSGAALKTHTDLQGRRVLDGIAQDLDGDAIFWRVLGATQGSARLSDDGRTLLFTPDAGYAGEARITVQADDGFNASTPMELRVNVSGARLLQIDIQRLATLALGTGRYLQVTGDFEDEAGVVLTGRYLDYVSSDSAVVSVTEDGFVRGEGSGHAIVQVKARGIEGVNVFTVGVDPRAPFLGGDGMELDVYPLAITLPNGGQRQLKVRQPDFSDISAATSGTRYFVADASIAEVSPDGLIIAKALGSTRISVIHQGTQYDLMLHVQQPVTGPVAVTAGGAVTQDGAGNTLMVAPGALQAGTTVSIAAMDVADVGMALPATDVLDVLGAWQLDLSGQQASLPVQLALNIGGAIEPGTQVQFWRKGTVLDEFGVQHDTWWLVDNGFVGADGIARTASPPFSGITGPGTLVATKSKITNNDTGAVEITGAFINFDVLWAQQAWIAMAPSPMMAISAIGIFAASASPVSAVKYTLDGSFRRQVPREALTPETISLQFPADPSAPASAPDILGLDYNTNTRELTISGTGFVPPESAASSFSFKVWLQPRGDQLTEPQSDGANADRGLVWQGFSASYFGGQLRVTLPANVSLTQHYVYVERIGYTVDGNGNQVPMEETASSSLVESWIRVDNYDNQGWNNSETLVTTANSLNVYAGPTGSIGTSTPGAITLTKRLFTDEQGRPLQLWGGYKNQIVYNDDGTLAFIAAQGGRIHVYDALSQTIVHTLQVQGSVNRISSLLVANGWLFVAEGSDYGGGGRVVRINIDQTSPSWMQVQQDIGGLRGVSAPLGFSDLAVSFGRYLAVTAPQQAISLFNGGISQGGNVYVIDLYEVNDRGELDGRARVAGSGNLPANTGKGPQFITAGATPGSFVLSSAKDYGAGVTGLSWSISPEGELGDAVRATKAKLTPAESDPNWLQKKHQQNIQRAADTVIAIYDGVEYALVADYNFIFNDAHWNDWENWGLGHQIGGKIGVIRDPFGRQGAPKYMGATTPIPGGSIKELSLAEDGNLYAEVWIDEGWGLNIVGRMFKSLFVWNSGALIQAAIQHEGQLLSKPIDLSGGVQFVAPARYDTVQGSEMFGWIYGIGNYSSREEVTYVRPEQIYIPPPPPPPAQQNLSATEMPLTDGVWETTMVRIGAYMMSAISAVEVGARRAFGMDDSAAVARMDEARNVRNTLMYDGQGNTITRGLAMAGEGMITGLLDMPLMALDALMRGGAVLGHMMGGGEGPIIDLPPVSEIAAAYDRGDVSALELFYTPILNVAQRNPVVAVTTTAFDLAKALVAVHQNRDESQASRRMDELVATLFGALASYGDAKAAKATWDSARASSAQGNNVRAAQELFTVERRLQDAVEDVNLAMRNVVKITQEIAESRTRASAHVPPPPAYYASRRMQSPDEITRLGRNIDTPEFRPLDGYANKAEQLSVPTWLREQFLGFEAAVSVLKARGVLTPDDGSYRFDSVNGVDFVEVTLSSVRESADSPPLKVRFELVDDSLVQREGQTMMARYQLAKPASGDLVANRDKFGLDDLLNPEDGVLSIKVARSTTDQGLDALSVAVAHELFEVKSLHDFLKREGPQDHDTLNNFVDSKHREARDFSDAVQHELHEQRDATRRENLSDEDGEGAPAALVVGDPRLKALTQEHENKVLSELGGPDLAIGQVKLYVTVNGVAVPIIVDGLRWNPVSGTFQIVDAKLSQAKDLSDARVDLHDTLTDNQKVAYQAIANGSATAIEYRGRNTAKLDFIKENGQISSPGRIDGVNLLDKVSRDIRIEVAYYNFVGGLPQRASDNPQIGQFNFGTRTYQGPLQNQSLATAEIGSTPAGRINTADIAALMAAARQIWLDAGASADVLDRVQVVIQELPAHVVGQASGQEIRVSPDAGGMGWFVDTTPLTAEEFELSQVGATRLALDGSAADDMVDLLTVLVHEMGHVLGLDDRLTDNDLMSGFLQTGMRRLPTAELLATRAEAPNAGITYSTVTGAVPKTATPVSRNAFVVAPELINAGFESQELGGWWTSGNVSTVGNGGTTLRETAAAQSRLAQAFIVNPGDRMLSFRVDARLLAGNARGPGDAFEVALLDASTGLPVLGDAGRVGLTRADALLNLQSSGSERLASGVRQEANVDGTSTYYIDLPETLAGLPVLLSFDLLGFGTLASAVTVSDIELVRDPRAVADHVELDEDQTATGNVSNNDITLGRQVRVERVDGPAHGQLVLAEDGSFSYVPEANYHGTDSFSYRLVDMAGRVSNTATVRLTLNPVNDAPTLPDTSLAATAGSAAMLDPLAGASDVDGDALTPRIVQGPAHGTLELGADGRFRYVAAAGYVGTDSFSWVVSDGQADSRTATVAVSVTADDAPNDAPTASDSLAQGGEDQALVLGWGDFVVADAQGTPLQIVVRALPVDGLLQRRLDDGTWVAVAVGDHLSQQRIEAGGLRFVPAADASGGTGYAEAGDGNRRQHYARLAYQAFDGLAYSTQASVVIHIAPVADAPLILREGTGVVAAQEDVPLNLPAVSALLADADGSEALLLTLTGLPAGFGLSDGVRQFAATGLGAVLDLAGWNLGALRLSPPLHWHGQVTLQLRASATEEATGEVAVTTHVLVIDVAAVADTPTLDLVAREVAVSRELLANGWEGVANPSASASVVSGATPLDGWAVTPARSGKTAAFEVYATGDVMRIATGNAIYAQPAPGAGTNWLRLHNGTNALAYQTLGIERMVDTVEGGRYTLSFQYAAGPGWPEANGLIGIYVDGQRIATYSATSPRERLDWRSVSFQFDGNGQARRVTVMLEGGNGVATSTAAVRAANLDALRIVETLPVGAEGVYGLVDTDIALPQVSAALVDGDGSEVLGIALTGLPEGAVLSDGTRRQVVNASGVVALTGWSLTTLALKPPSGFVGTLQIGVRALATEGSNLDASASERTLQVVVLAGQAVATPAGVNPFVVMSGAQAPLRQEVRPVAAESQAPFVARSSAEEAEEEQKRQRRASEAWLQELEQAAKAQWTALMGAEA